ncbi:hemerythrin domain-containing protein [Intrasporangium sp. DVR]|uniref:hemerythrin domain-containing protein n=1 Tax=Intrasporangium sp. DVR TaxID=3127867 RepID=UPI00313A6BB0
MEARVATLHEIRATLHAEHEHLWHLLAMVRHASADDRHPALGSLLRYVAVHEAAEEVAMHNSWVVDSTRERLDEEREIADIIERLVRAHEAQPVADLERPLVATSDDEFLVTLDQLERTLRDHAEAEENEELPILAAELSPDRLGDILRLLLMVREMAGDPASPISGDTFTAMRLAAQREFKAAQGQLR